MTFVICAAVGSRRTAKNICQPSVNSAFLLFLLHDAASTSLEVKSKCTFFGTGMIALSIYEPMCFKTLTKFTFY